MTQCCVVQMKFDSFDVLEENKRFNDIALIVLKNLKDLGRSNDDLADFTVLCLCRRTKWNANGCATKFVRRGHPRITKGSKLIGNIGSVIFDKVKSDPFSASIESVVRAEGNEILSGQDRRCVGPSVDLL